QETKPADEGQSLETKTGGKKIILRKLTETNTVIIHSYNSNISKIINNKTLKKLKKLEIRRRRDKPPATGGGARGRRRQLPLLFIFVICSGLPFFLVIVVLLGSVVGAPVGPSTSLSSSSVSAFCEVVFVVERSPGFLPFPCLASRIGRGFDLGSREVIDFFYRFVHRGLMAVWLSSFCDSMSATSSRMVGLSSMAFSNFWFGGCSLFVVVSYLLCPGSGVRYGWCLFAACFVRIRCSGLQVKDICELFLGESYHKERIIGQTNFYRVMTLGFTVASPSAASPSAASPSAASGLFRLGEASGKLCLLVVSAQISLSRVFI
ncbi:unnamed protein product, partial [Brassica oleracea]